MIGTGVRPQFIQGQGAQSPGGGGGGGFPASASSTSLASPLTSDLHLNLAALTSSNPAAGLHLSDLPGVSINSLERQWSGTVSFFFFAF